MKVEKVKITEVGPRDGFQSERTILKTEDKIDVINNLIDAGCQRICLLYTSPSPRDVEESRMPSSA